jgi:hypothetical protein
MSKQHAVIALSTTRVEYMEATHGSKEVAWMQWLCSGIGFEHKYMKIICNNQSAIFMAKNPGYHSKTKHIGVQCHFVRDMLESNKVLLEKVDTLENIEDSSTNFLSVAKFSCYIEAMGYISLGL